MIRRYRVRVFYDQTEQLLKDRIHLAGLDLETGPGLQAASVEADRLIRAVVKAAGKPEKVVPNCHLTVHDGDSDAYRIHFYPFPNPTPWVA